jgi:hypothetical protein
VTGKETARQTTDLTEFLTARLDEDGHLLHHDERFDGECHCGGDGVATQVGCPARLDADIRAKRRIVQKAMTYEPLRDTGDATANAGVVVAKMIYDVVLRELASVYADHPDYRQEWGVGA